MTAPDPTAELEQRLRAGDPDAAAALFALHRDRLRRMVRLRLDRRLQGRLDASDVLNEAALDVGLREWRPDGGDLEAEPRWPGASGRSRCIALSPAGRVRAAGNPDGTVSVWDGRSDDVTTFRGHEGPVNSVAFRPDGRRLVSGGADTTVRVWDPGGGEEPLTLRGPGGPLNALAFSADGARLAAGDWGGDVRVWDAASGEELSRWRARSGRVSGLAFSPDGRHLAAAAQGPESGELAVFDAESGAEVWRQVFEATAYRRHHRGEWRKHRGRVAAS